MNEDKKKEKKYRFTTKTWFYLGGLGALLGFIVLSAVWDLTFGYFDVVNFVADTLILTAISIGSLVLSEKFSEESNMNKLVGVYNLSVNEYMAIIATVDGIRVYFSQWYYWFLARETKAKREGYLMLHGIDGTTAKKIVRYATLTDIEPMANATKHYIKVLEDGRKIVFDKLETNEQREAVKEVLSGMHDIKDTNYSNYLFIDDIKEANMSMLERQNYLEKRRAEMRKRAMVFAILRLVTTSLLMAALVPAAPEEQTANKWWTFCKRIGVFFTSLLIGWKAGSNDVIARAAIVKDKANIIRQFKDCNEKGLWRPKTEEEMDAEIIAQWEKEQEEAKQAVIDPIIVPSNTLMIGGGDNG